ncbi:hypothetical protein Q31b_33160 [Novipirellula aureliae]|uniref:SIR2-like domain-containing protein n=1 Tax=Novipirellula aureliae TaxID=2527966 RepID=A0A5C6DTE8_9BACT|nr:hypothetical protein [Novipirellula aureliae]TWU40000.1 hypothetical protein Q31b_33160 [Novipirellula aureliae]
MDDWDFHGTSLVVLGAGFSYAATDGGTPLMQGYFDRLNQREYPDLHKFVVQVGCDRSCPTVSDANVERVLLTLEQARTANALMLDGWFEDWIPKLQVLRDQLGRYTLFRLSDQISMDDENWAVNLLARTGFNTSYISLNYDNIAESILSARTGTVHCRNANCPHCKMRRLLQFSCSCGETRRDLGRRWHGSLIKLHGSIAWRRCVCESCCAKECIDADCRCAPFSEIACEYCGEACVPVMVFPTMSKNLGEIPQIGTMWQAARAALEEAESILLFGFSLPTSDELLAQLMRNACEKHRNLRRVGAIDLNPEQVLDRFRQAVNPTCDIEYVPLLVEPGKVPAWYRAPASPALEWCGQAPIQSN